MNPETLLLEKDPSGLAVITLNRPAAMNALSRQLRQELTDTFEALGRDASVRVIILTGAGRAFCAGLDLKELGQTGLQRLGTGAPGDPLRALEKLRQPVIAAINGACVTGGFEITLACDVIVASTQARFADTHGRVGVMPGWGLSQRLSRAIGPYRAKELSLSGSFLDAQRAYEWGLVNRVVPPEELMATARQLAAAMLSALPHMLPVLKSVIDDGFALALGDGLRLETARAAATNDSVAPDVIEANRRAILTRNRAP